VLTFGKLRVYVAGDTEDVPEMADLKAIDIAFLPMNQPYTMKPEQVAAAAKAFRPRILYPYHFSSTNTALLPPLLADEKDIEIRIRKLQ
jgi:L-ascorbate metabolism protein UlaG (beta-lactamase superfamily)